MARFGRGVPRLGATRIGPYGDTFTTIAAPAAQATASGTGPALQVGTTIAAPAAQATAYASTPVTTLPGVNPPPQRTVLAGHRVRGSATRLGGVFGSYEAPVQGVVAAPPAQATASAVPPTSGPVTIAAPAAQATASATAPALAIPGPLGFKSYGTGGFPTISVGQIQFSGATQDGDIGFGGGTFGAAEPSAYFDGTTYHLWYHRINADASVNTIDYATGPTLEGPWTQLGTIVAGNFQCPQVVYVNGTFHLTATNVANSSHTVDYYTATSPAGPWTLAQAAIMTVGSSTQWDGDAFGNTFPYWDGSQWWMFYEARNTTSYGTAVSWNFGTWRIGLASGPTLTSLTKYASNPVFDLAPGQEGGRAIGSPYVEKVGNTLYVLLHENDGGTAASAYLTPSSIALWESPNADPRGPWQRVGWVHRLYNDTTALGEQLADPFAMTTAAVTHLLWDQTSGQTPYTNFKLGHASVVGTLADLAALVGSSPISETTPTTNTGQVVLTRNVGATVTPIVMDGVPATALGADPGTSQTAGTYWLSGTTLKLGTSGKTHVTLANPATIIAPPAAQATASGSAPALTVNAAAPNAQATASATPSVPVVAPISPNAPATASSTAPALQVTVIVPGAQATGSVTAPPVGAAVTVLPPAAQATATPVAPGFTVTLTVPAASAVAAPNAPTPSIQVGATAGTATASSTAPGLAVILTANSQATAAGTAPVLNIDLTLFPPTAFANATGVGPKVATGNGPGHIFYGTPGHITDGSPGHVVYGPPGHIVPTT